MVQIDRSSSPRWWRRWSVIGLVAGTLVAAGLGVQAGSLATTPAAASEAEVLRMRQVADALVVSGWTHPELEALRSSFEAGASGSEALKVRVVIPGRDTATLPPVVGEVRLEGERLEFRPRYGWSPGQRYEARLDVGRALGSRRLSRAIETSFVVDAPAPVEGPPRVAEVYPTTDVVPKNLLRFYVEFSAPMRRGDAHAHVQLLDSAGDPVDGPFLSIGRELWSADMRQLTIILDPGRIKRGVAPNREVSEPLTESNSYTLVIQPGLTDAHGRALSAEHRKSFEVAAADRASPRPTKWQLTVPAAGSQQALEVRLDDMIDPIVAQRSIRIHDVDGQPIPGTLAFDHGERAFTFVPQTRWTSSRYRLAVHPGLEDFAGNRVDSVFDMHAGTVGSLARETMRPIVREFQPT